MSSSPQATIISVSDNISIFKDTETWDNPFPTTNKLDTLLKERHRHLTKEERSGVDYWIKAITNNDDNRYKDDQHYLKPAKEFLEACSQIGRPQTTENISNLFPKDYSRTQAPPIVHQIARGGQGRPEQWESYQKDTQIIDEFIAAQEAAEETGDYSYLTDPKFQDYTEEVLGVGTAANIDLWPKTRISSTTPPLFEFDPSSSNFSSINRC